jgi:MFS transporter, ACS family, D-galactonate transporter
MQECVRKIEIGRVLDFLKYRSFLLMFFGFMCCNTLFNGLLTSIPSYLMKEHAQNPSTVSDSRHICRHAASLLASWQCRIWNRRVYMQFSHLLGARVVIPTTKKFPGIPIISAATTPYQRERRRSTSLL